MAEPVTIARPYAEAVFKLAQQSGALDAWSQQLARLAAAAANPDVVSLITDPRITEQQRVQLFLDALGGEASNEMRNFLQLLAQNDRLPLLPEIARRYEEYKNEVQGVMDAYIDSAYPLDEGQLRSLVGDLERRFRRRIQPHVNVDGNLIGGVKVVVGDTVIDGSVRGKLAEMSAALRRA